MQCARFALLTPRRERPDAAGYGPAELPLKGWTAKTPPEPLLRSNPLVANFIGLNMFALEQVKYFAYSFGGVLSEDLKRNFSRTPNKVAGDAFVFDYWCIGHVSLVTVVFVAQQLLADGMTNLETC